MNVFVELEKSKPGSNCTPFENYTTTCLKVCLNSDKAFLRKFVSLISKKSKKTYQSPFKVYTQHRIYDSIIDLVIEDVNNKKLLIEIKTGSNENEYGDEKETYGQIEKYCRLEKGEVALLADTYYSIEVNKSKNLYLGQITWTDVWKLIRKNSMEILLQFKEYLEEMELVKIPGFSADLLEHADFFYKQKKAIQITMDAIINELRPIEKKLNLRRDAKRPSFHLNWDAYEINYLEESNQVWLDTVARIYLAINDWSDQLRFSVGFKLNPSKRLSDTPKYNKLIQSYRDKNWTYFDSDWTIIEKGLPISKLPKTPEKQLEKLTEFAKKNVLEAKRFSEDYFKILKI